MASPPSDTCSAPLRHQLPRSLREWKIYSMNGMHSANYRGYRDIWNPLEPFLRTQGLELWQMHVECGTGVYRPRDGKRRTPDGLTYEVLHESDEGENTPIFQTEKSKHCAATTADGRHVMLRLISICNDGAEHVDIVRNVANERVASRETNHTLPMVQEVSWEDMTFAVFPLMHDCSLPWFRTISEVMDFIVQVTEGLVFLHKRLIAHWDIFLDNILINAVGTGRLPFANTPDDTPPPFRELFPCRYYINDFEMAVMFAPDSDPSTRTVTGIPGGKGRTGRYSRPTTPEMLQTAPYCPFKADIFQLGASFQDYVGHLTGLNGMQSLFADMQGENPSERPSAAEVLERVKHIKAETPRDVFYSWAEPPPFDDPQEVVDYWAQRPFEGTL